MIARVVFGAALLAAMLCGPAMADDKCRLRPAASVAMGHEPGGRITVPVLISGRSFNLLVDTGGVDSALTETTVKSLGLTPRALDEGRYLSMFGGTPITQQVVAHDVVFGGLATPSKGFLVMPDDLRAPGVDGLLAPDILRAYDADFDFGHSRFTLFSQNHCDGEVVYWTGEPYTRIEIGLDKLGHVRLPITLDGRNLWVTLDTGASHSVFSWETAESLFGLREDTPGVVVSGKAGGDRLYRFPFKSLAFGGVSISNPDFILVPDHASRTDTGASVLIGIDILRQLHLYIAYKERRLYITSAMAH